MARGLWFAGGATMNVGPSERILITGVTGFAGGHLAEYCLSLGWRVFGITRNPAQTRSGVELIEGDICDKRMMQHALREARPQMIFHLAAQTSDQSQADQLFNTNILGTLNLLEVCANLRPAPLLHIAGSSACYGAIDHISEPITENSPLKPIGAYGVSKAAQDLIAERFGYYYELPIVRTRAFNHTGPRERDEFVCSAIAKQLVQIEKGKHPPRISVGNLETKRDFSDVRDIVRGYYLALTRGKAGDVFNLASGRAVSIKAILQRSMEISGIKAEVIQETDRIRASDVPSQIGDYAKAKHEIGWTPEITLDQSLKDLLSYWRKKINTPK